MISYLKGTLVSKIINSSQGIVITVEVNGIGYAILANPRTMSALPEIGSEVQVFTSLVHKEDAMLLCGFAKHEDRDLFNILQSVSGIGIKVALMLLDEMDAFELMRAVLSEDIKALTRTKGVGAKVAQRLVLELKDKLKAFSGDFVDKYGDVKKLPGDISESFIEAQSVLLALGYTPQEIDTGLQSALGKLGKDATSEQLLKIALEVISF